MNRTRIGIALLALVAGTTQVSHAETVGINYNISGIGGYTSDPSTPDFGWSYPHAGMGTATVTANSADLKTDPTNAEVGALYLDTGLNTQARTISLSFDVDVLSQAFGKDAQGNDFYGQTKTISGVASPILFGVRLWDGSNWATSFQLSPTSTTTGVFGMRNGDNASLTTFGSGYTVGQVNHIQIDANYDAGNANVFLNGSLATTVNLVGGVPPAGATTSEIFAYLNGTSHGTSNEVLIGDALPTPLPRSAWMGLVLMGGVAAFAARRKLAL